MVCAEYVRRRGFLVRRCFSNEAMYYICLKDKKYWKLVRVSGNLQKCSDRTVNSGRMYLQKCYYFKFKGAPDIEKTFGNIKIKF